MQAIGRQPQHAPGGRPVQCERHRPEQTTLYRLVQQHAATFFAQTEAAAGADLPQFVKTEPRHNQSGGLFVPGKEPGRSQRGALPSVPTSGPLNQCGKGSGLGRHQVGLRRKTNSPSMVRPRTTPFQTLRP